MKKNSQKLEDKLRLSIFSSSIYQDIGIQLTPGYVKNKSHLLGNCFKNTSFNSPLIQSILYSDMLRAVSVLESGDKHQLFTDISNLVRYLGHDKTIKDNIVNSLKLVSKEKRLEIVLYLIHVKPKNIEKSQLYEGSVLHNLLLCKSGISIYCAMVDGFTDDELDKVGKLKNLHDMKLSSLRETRYAFEKLNKDLDTKQQEQNWRCFTRLRQFPVIFDTLANNARGKNWAQDFNCKLITQLYLEKGFIYVAQIFSPSTIKLLRHNVLTVKEILDNKDNIEVLLESGINKVIENISMSDLNDESETIKWVGFITSLNTDKVIKLLKHLKEQNAPIDLQVYFFIEYFSYHANEEIGKAVDFVSALPESFNKDAVERYFQHEDNETAYLAENLPKLLKEYVIKYYWDYMLIDTIPALVSNPSFDADNQGHRILLETLLGRIEEQENKAATLSVL